MKARRTIVLIAVTSLLVGSFLLARWQGPAAAKHSAKRGVASRGPLHRDEQSVITLFREAAPSVVFITSLAKRRNPFRFNTTEIPRGNGTGFIWDKNGHIVTNFHVISGAHAARVTLTDQSTWDAELVGAAPEKDLAVLRISAPAKQLQPIALGRSEDLVVGQKVMAIGNPFGLDHTLTTGIISALGREIESVARTPIRDLIQTDAAINPGNSGGPLLDSAGRLIGVNTAIYSPSGAYAGIGFAIPVDTVNWVAPDLITHGRVLRPTLGIEVAPRHLASRLGIRGVLILDIVPGSGAELAGLQPTRRDDRGGIHLGDVITAIEDVPVASLDQLRVALEKYRGGQRVQVYFLRQGRKLSAYVPLTDGA